MMHWGINRRETGATITPEEIAKNVKKFMGTLLVFFMIISATPETSNSAETTKQFTNTTLVECFTCSAKTRKDLSKNFIQRIDQAKIQTKENSFQDIFMPSPIGKEHDFSSKTNGARGSYLYGSEKTEDIVINGKYDKELIEQNTKEWTEAIKNGIETQKNYVSFELIPKGFDRYTLKATGISPELNKYEQIYINAVAIENIVNLPYYENGMSTIRNLVREWLFKDKKDVPSERGESFFIKNGETVSKDIELDIPKGLKNKYKVVAWAQVNDGRFIAREAEILSAGVCHLYEGKVLKFNWNNWPKNMQDENLMVKPEYYMPLGLGEMNFNLENAENLKTINFDFNKLDFKDTYRIVGVKPNPELFDITFGQRYNRTTIVFKKPINGNLENAITFITDFKKSNVATSSGLRFCWLDMRDKDGNFPYIDMSGEPIQYGPVKLVAHGFKPLDFNQDKRINYDDVNELIKHFGRNHQDSNWDPRYDTDQNNRVDIIDLVAAIKAADAEAALRAQFHDNLKRLDIWETGIMPVCKIKSARYGYDDKWSDVTELLQRKLEKGTFDLHVMDENLGSNPYPGAFKYLEIVYDDTKQKDFKIELEQFSTMKFQKECDSSQSTGKKDAKSYTHKDYLLYYQ